MMVDQLINEIKKDQRCTVLPSKEFPILQIGLTLPKDLKHFYELVGGVSLHINSNYPINISEPNQLIRANPIIVGDECEDDISYDWFVIGKGKEQYITIDLNPSRLGLCYDSFWDRHGIPGESVIIANNFTELLKKLYEENGNYWYWLKDGFEYIGDAYDKK